MFRFGPYARVRFQDDPPADPSPDPSRSGPADWIGGLPEDLRNNDILGDHKLGEGEKMVSVPPSVIKSHLHAQTMIGKDKVVIPGETATEEEWNQLYTKLGRPAEASGYEFTPPQIEGADTEVITKLTDGFRDMAHKTGLTKSQAEAVYGWYLEAYAKEIESVNEIVAQSLEASTAELKRVWGDQYDQKLKAATALVDKYGDEDIKSWLEASGAGNSPAYIKLMSNIAGQFGEDVLKVGISGAIGVMTQEEGEKELAKLRAHPGYMDGQHPEHQSILERISRINDQIYGTTPVGQSGVSV